MASKSKETDVKYVDALVKENSELKEEVQPAEVITIVVVNILSLIASDVLICFPDLIRTLSTILYSYLFCNYKIYIFRFVYFDASH